MDEIRLVPVALDSFYLQLGTIEEVFNIQARGNNTVLKLNSQRRFGAVVIGAFVQRTFRILLIFELTIHYSEIQKLFLQRLEDHDVKKLFFTEAAFPPTPSHFRGEK